MKKKRLLTDRTAGLEDEMAKELSREMAEEVDWEIMCDIMKQLGWTEVKISWPKNMSETVAHKIKEWCRHNLTGNYKGRGQNWIFENSIDATMFVVKWS